MRGILYSPVSGSLSVSMRSVSGMFIAEFHAMLAMYMNSVSILYGSPFQAIADQQVHEAMRGDRRVPRKRLVDARRRAVVVDDQILGPHRIAERRAGQRLAGDDAAGLAGRFRPRRGRFRVGRFVAPAARDIDRADQDLQQMQARGRSGSRSNGPRCRASHAPRPAGRASSRGDGRPSRSRVARSRSPARMRCGRSRRRASGCARPGCRRPDPPFRARIAGRDSARRSAGTPAPRGGRRGAWRRRRCAPRHRAVSRSRGRRRGAQHQRLAALVAGEKTVIGGAGVLDHQPGGVGVAAEIGQIDLVGAQQFVDQRQHEQPVGAGADADPFVGDRRIAGAHRVNRNELGAAPSQAGQCELDRVRIVVLGDAEHQK